MGQRRGDLGLERGQVGWIGLRVERRHGDPARALHADPDQGVGRQAGVQGVQRLAHLGLKVGDEAIGFERQVQRLVVRGSLRLEVGRHVVVRVAVAVGADHPDLLAPQLVAERLQGADLIGDPVDARPPLGVLLDDRLAPEPAHHAVDRNVFVGGEGVQLGVGVLLQEVEGLDDRAMASLFERKSRARRSCGTMRR